MLNIKVNSEMEKNMVMVFYIKIMEVSIKDNSPMDKNMAKVSILSMIKNIQGSSGKIISGVKVLSSMAMVMCIPVNSSTEKDKEKVNSTLRDSTK